MGWSESKVFSIPCLAEDKEVQVTISRRSNLWSHLCLCSWETSRTFQSRHWREEGESGEHGQAWDVAGTQGQAATV